MLGIYVKINSTRSLDCIPILNQSDGKPYRKFKEESFVRSVTAMDRRARTGGPEILSYTKHTILSFSSNSVDDQGRDLHSPVIRESKAA